MRANTKAAKVRLEAATKDIAEIKVDDITKEAEKLVSKDTLKFKAQELADLKSFESKISGLADDIKPADLEKFIKENAKSFGITGDEKQLKLKPEDWQPKVKQNYLPHIKLKSQTLKMPLIQ